MFPWLTWKMCHIIAGTIEITKDSFGPGTLVEIVQPSLRQHLNRSIEELIVYDEEIICRKTIKSFCDLNEHLLLTRPRLRQLMDHAIYV